MKKRTAREIANALTKRVAISYEDALVLARAEMTLTRWAEKECGDSNAYISWAIERDEQTDKPYMVTYRHDSNKSRRSPVADLEKGALRRIARICQEYGLHFFHQTDPRGCALYISKEPMTDNKYNNGVAVC